jgi:hypothetical protein
MGVRFIAVVAGVLVSGAALAEDGSRLQLASLVPPLGHQGLEQRLQRMSVRLPEPGTVERAVGLEAKSRPAARSHATRLLKPVLSNSSAARPASLDGLGAGYGLFFGPPAGPLLPSVGSEAHPNRQGAEPAVWTVLNGPAGHHAEATPARAAELGPAAELLVALRAGF